MTLQLRLGPLPKVQSVRLTIALSVELKAILDRYAEVHAQATGQKNDVAKLVPHILATFIANDRAFRVLSTQGKNDRSASAAAPETDGAHSSRTTPTRP